MVWVCAAIALGLVGIAVEVVLAFRRRADELRAQQAHERDLVRKHRAAIADLQDRKASAEAHIEELRRTKNELTGDLDWLSQELAELRERWQRRHIGGGPLDGSPP